MRKEAQTKPAFRFAHRVRAITPLFWAKILIVSLRMMVQTYLMGVTVNRAEKNPAIPSARIPPWIRLSNSGFAISEMPHDWTRTHPVDRDPRQVR